MVLRRNFWAVVGLIGIAQAQYANTTETPSPTDEAANRKTHPTTTSKAETCKASTVTLAGEHCYPATTTVTLPTSFCHPTTITCYVTVTPTA